MMSFLTRDSRFPPGRLLITPGAIGAVTKTDSMYAFFRHLQGDWGDVSESDWKRNDQALKSGGRLFSVYHSSAGREFWIITEADRTSTTILMPEDY